MRIVAAGIVALVLVHPMAQAQQTTMTSGNGGAAYTGMEKAQDPTKEMLLRFVEASRLTLAADQQILLALGQEKEAATIAERLRQLDSGMTRKDVEDTFEAQLRGVAASGKALVGGVQPNAVQLSSGLAVLAQALAEYNAMLADLPDARNAMNIVRKASKTDTPAFFMLRALPGNAASLKTEIRAVAEASRKAGATVPEVLLSN
jgi:hypothetical protein